MIEIVKRAGYEIFYPEVFKQRDVPKRRITASQRNSPFKITELVRERLFHRYPFVRFDILDGRWRGAFDLAGIHGVLCNRDGGRLPAPVTDQYVTALRHKAPDGGMPEKITVRELAYEIGEVVRISQGSFGGFNARIAEIPDVPISRLDAGSRLTLLVAMFGRETPVELTLADIDKL